jgi:hypothetical protein
LFAVLAGVTCVDAQDNANVCPFYIYASHSGYCSWYAQKCGSSPISINLPCNHGSGSCPDNNCVTVPAAPAPANPGAPGRPSAPTAPAAAAAPAAASAAASHPKPKVKLDKLSDKLDSHPKLTLPLAHVQKKHFVKIHYKEDDDTKTIYARINEVSLPEIIIGGTTIPGETVKHGYELKPLADDDPDVVLVPFADITITSENELQVNMLNGVAVEIGVVTKTKVQ